MLAILGAAGAGKSTLIHLFLGFMNRQKEPFILDDKNVQDLPL